MSVASLDASTPATPTSRPRQPGPFVKWPGGKRLLLPEILGRVPASYGAYYEPFVGGGAVFFALDPTGNGHRAYLSDVNRRLATTYRAVRDHPDKVIAALLRHATRPGKPHYLKVRDRFNSGRLDPVGIAAAFIYLNKNCFNGVYRENSSGKFNVPWRESPSRWVPDIEGILAASGALQGAQVTDSGFDAVPVDPDGFYYFDPPYDGTFSSYSRGGFDADAHRRLADLCCRLDQVGARWLLSNSDTPFVRDLYRDFELDVVLAKRSVNRSATGRGKVAEVLVRNFEPTVQASDESAA